MSLAVAPPALTKQESNVATAATVLGTTVTASATPHTKGAYAQLIAASAFDTYWVEVVLGEVGVSAAATSLLVDIAIGAAAAETVIIPNLNAGFSATQAGTGPVGAAHYAFPLKVPAGSRISARCQSLVVSDTVKVQIRLYGGPAASEPPWAGQRVIDIGTDLATSKGVTVAAGLSAAAGTWTQIVASLAEDIAYLAAGLGGAADTTLLLNTGLLDIGVGAAAAESAVLSAFPFWSVASEMIGWNGPIRGWVPVKAGERIAARISIDAAGASSYDVICYGVVG